MANSIFIDMRDERDILLEKAYPVLRTFCQKMGLDFQAMDMRWGIQGSAAVDHSTCDLCLNEIRTCKRTSAGPYFVVFVGNRYGWQPIPSSMTIDHFKTFVEIAQESNPKDAELLNTWYKRDDNVVPPLYVLQPITKLYRYYDDVTPENVTKRNRDREKWSVTSERLSEIIRKYAKIAMEREIINQSDGGRYFKSVTESEIEEGLLSQSNSKEISHVYRREISGINDVSVDEMKRKYIDVKDSFGNVNTEAQKLLVKLKDEIGSYMNTNQNNVKLYELDLLDNEEISKEKHDQYLEQFCADFINDLKNAIKISHKVKSDQSESPENGNDWLFKEVEHQALFCQNKCKSFCGRKALIENIMNVLHDKSTLHPVVLFGQSGRGKTCLVAMVIKTTRSRSSEDVLVYRFLGSSPTSSHIHNVLQGIILQISEVFNLTPPPSYVLQNFTSVVQKFLLLLDEISSILEKEGKERKLIICLDSLDQLSNLDGALRLNWLPKTLPPNVSILVSTLPNPSLNILQILERTLPDTNLIEVPQLDEETGVEILNTLLADVNRSLTDEQHSLVMAAFNKTPQPLFLKLAFDEAKRWHSYTASNNLVLNDSIQGAIHNYFDYLEKQHGSFFVGRAVGYLVASKNGITEIELNDLLSLDDELLDRTYLHWPPSSNSTVRMPLLMWSRLRHKVSSDIVERQAVKSTVLAFYHRQFIEVAKVRYITSSTKPVIHGNLAEYFLGTWADGKKKKLKLKIWNNRTYQTDRKVSSQPLEFGKEIYNHRKLNELPYHLLHSGKWKTLFDQVVFNIDWITTKINASSIKDLLDDLDMILEKKQNTEVILLRDTIKLAKPTLEFPGGVRNSIACELFGRLAYFEGAFPNSIGKLTRECRRELRKEGGLSLVPLNGCFQPPGGPLRTTLTGLSKPVSCVTMSDSILIAASSGGKMLAWEVGRDEVIHSIKAHDGAVHCMATHGLRVASGSIDNTIHIFNLDTGSRVAKLDEDHSGYKDQASMKFSCDGNTLISASGSQINIWNVSKLDCELKLNRSHLLTCDIVINNKDQLLAGYSDGKCICWSIETGEEVYSINTTDIQDNGVSKIFLCGDQLYTLFNNGVVVISDIENGNEISKLDVSRCSVSAVSSSGQFIACAVNNSVEIFKLQNNMIKDQVTLSHHRDVITSLLFQNETTLIVGSNDQTISVWKLAAKLSGLKPSEVITGMGASVDYLFASDQVLISASSMVFYLKLWNLERQKIVKEPFTFNFDVNTNVVSRCGKYLANLDNREQKISVHFIATEDYAKVEDISIAAHQNADVKGSCVAFTNNSKEIIYSTNMGDIVKKSNPFVKTRKLSPKRSKPKEVGMKLKGPIPNISLSNDGELLLALSCDQNDDSDWLVLINADDFQLLSKVPAKELTISGKISTLCLSDDLGDQVQVIVGTNDCLVHIVRHYFSQDNWDLTQTLDLHKSPLTCVKLNANNDLLFTGSEGKAMRLWSLKDDIWFLHHEMKFDSLMQSGVTCCAFMHDGDHVTTGSHERSVKVWNVKTGELVTAQYVYASVTGLTITNDDRIIVTTKMGSVIISKLVEGGFGKELDFVQPLDGSRAHSAKTQSKACNIT